jgi:hypothetical protein
MIPQYMIDGGWRTSEVSPDLLTHPAWPMPFSLEAAAIFDSARRFEEQRRQA